MGLWESVSTTEIKCPNDFNLLVVETNECVISCPNDYPFYIKVLV